MPYKDEAKRVEYSKTYRQTHESESQSWHKKYYLKRKKDVRFSPSPQLHNKWGKLRVCPKCNAEMIKSRYGNQCTRCGYSDATKDYVS